MWKSGCIYRHFEVQFCPNLALYGKCLNYRCIHSHKLPQCVHDCIIRYHETKDILCCRGLQEAVASGKPLVYPKQAPASVSIGSLMAENARLEAENAELQAYLKTEHATLCDNQDFLLAEKARQEAENATLRKENDALQSRISALEKQLKEVKNAPRLYLTCRGVICKISTV